MSDELTIVEKGEGEIVFTENELARVQTQAMIAGTRKRDEQACLNAVVVAATKTTEIAKACFYAVPRAKKIIEGPGIHLAILMAQKWGNLAIRTQVIRETDKMVVAKGFVWDLIANNFYDYEEEMRIVDKQGKKYPLDMILMTRKACQSKALRGAIFRCIGKIQTFETNQRIQNFASGKDSGEPLPERVGKMLSYFGKLKVSEDRIMWLLQVGDTSDITEDHLVTLIGISTAIKDKEVSLEEAFPPTPQEKAKGKGEQLATDMLPDPMRTSDKDEVKK